MAASLIIPLAQPGALFPDARAKLPALSPDSPLPAPEGPPMIQVLDRADGELAGNLGVPELSAFAAGLRATGTPTRPPGATSKSASTVPPPIPAAPDGGAPRGRKWRRLGRKHRPRTPAPPRPDRRGGGMIAAVLATAGLGVTLAVAAAAAGYLTFPHAALFSRVHGTALTALVPAGALAAIIAAVAAWRTARRQLEGRKSADVLTVLAATVAMIVSATGMWAFFERYVPTVPVLIRIPIFAFLEIATLSSALRSRDNMREEIRRAAEESREPSCGLDIDGLAMWGLTGISAFLASLASTTIAEALFRLAPPLVAAWLWERALVSERRRRTGRRKQEQSTWRISPQRILVRLGLLDPAGKTTGEAAAQRRITILALAAEQAAALEAAGIGPDDKRRARADRKLRAALRKAVDEADLATSRERQMALVAQLRILRAPQDLVTLDTESPWAQLAGPRRERREERREERRRDDERREDKAREERKDDQRQDGGTLGQLADTLSQALRQQDADQVHDLLADRDDYVALVRWLGRNGKFGAKRLMAVAAMYAVPGTMASPAKGTAWVAGIVPGKPGNVDKAEIRRLRELIEPVWTARNYPGPAAVGGGKDDTEE